MGRNFEVQPSAENNFYLPLTIENIYAFAVFANKYLHPLWQWWHQFYDYV